MDIVSNLRINHPEKPPPGYLCTIFASAYGHKTFIEPPVFLFIPKKPLALQTYS